MRSSRVEKLYNDEKLLLYVFNYRTFINEQTINVMNDIQYLNLINTVNTRVKALNSIQDKIEKYGKYSAAQLVDITHSSFSPWTKSGGGDSQYREIRDDLILKFHKYEVI